MTVYILIKKIIKFSTWGKDYSCPSQGLFDPSPPESVLTYNLLYGLDEQHLSNAHQYLPNHDLRGPHDLHDLHDLRDPRDLHDLHALHDHDDGDNR